MRKECISLDVAVGVSRCLQNSINARRMPATSGIVVSTKCTYIPGIKVYRNGSGMQWPRERINARRYGCRMGERPRAAAGLSIGNLAIRALHRHADSSTNHRFQRDSKESLRRH